MIRLTKHQVLHMHKNLIKQFGGMEGIRDEGLLDAALSTPFQSFSGEDLFPTLQAKAARLAYGLIKNHAMLDGNKRLGAHVMLVFLALNGIELSYTQKDLYTIILSVASGECSLERLSTWILEHQL